jgi:hypothetical protein
MAWQPKSTHFQLAVAILAITLNHAQGIPLHCGSSSNFVHANTTTKKTITHHSRFLKRV